MVSVISCVKGKGTEAGILLKPAFIIGAWGATYGLVLVTTVVHNPGIPYPSRLPVLMSGLAASLQTLFVAILGAVTVIELFRPFEQK